MMVINKLMAAHRVAAFHKTMAMARKTQPQGSDSACVGNAAKDQKETHLGQKYPEDLVAYRMQHGILVEISINQR